MPASDKHQSSVSQCLATGTGCYHKLIAQLQDSAHHRHLPAQILAMSEIADDLQQVKSSQSIQVKSEFAYRKKKLGISFEASHDHVTSLLVS